jgi:hypothetical protein
LNVTHCSSQKVPRRGVRICTDVTSLHR